VTEKISGWQLQQSQRRIFTKGITNKNLSVVPAFGGLVLG
jgi:hypothetical protein